MQRVLSIIVLSWLAAIHVALGIACFTMSGCQHRPRHVDYIPAQPRREYQLPHYYVEPRRRMEREA